MFRKRKDNVKEVVVEIPCWIEAPYNLIAHELVNCGLAEQWQDKLKGCEATDVVNVLSGAPVKAGDVVSLARHKRWQDKLKGCEATDVVNVLSGAPVKTGDVVSCELAEQWQDKLMGSEATDVNVFGSVPVKTGDVVSLARHKQWQDKLMGSEATDVVNVFGSVPVKTGDVVSLGRRIWILASAYSVMHERKLKMQKKSSQVEQKMIELGCLKTVMECNTRLLKDKLEHYQNVAQKAAIKIAQNKYKKRRRGKVNKTKVHKSIASASINWDPDTWDGDVWDSSSSSDEEDYHKGKIQANPVRRRLERTENEIIREHVRDGQGNLQYDEDGNAITNEKTIPHVKNRVTIEDYSQGEVDSILTQFRQKPGEGEIPWLVRVHDLGGGEVHFDAGDVAKFVTMSRDPEIQRSIKNYFVDHNEHGTQNLIMILAHAFLDKYPSEADFPINDKPWYTLKDGMERLKEEAMRNALPLLGLDDDYLQYPLTASISNRLVKHAPPAYKTVILTLTVALTGESIGVVLGRMKELQDMGQWDKPSPGGHVGNSKPNNPDWKEKSVGEAPWVPRKDMFQALLKAGINKERIDGKETGELWKLYKQKVLSAKKVTTTNVEGGSKTPKVKKSEGKGENPPKKVSWEDFQSVYPWEELAAAVATKVTEGRANAQTEVCVNESSEGSDLP
ncbi:uncharacterized protein ACNLHF_026473 [Anomaloglossus baeobatrachus]|uniref:uncharacterized protein LOC142245243 n=1 Tax=Anomaloglossus baeobatrachus TaxID=238106 RepID=UPI003F50A238